MSNVLYHPSLLPCSQVMVQENEAIARHTSSPNPTFTLHESTSSSLWLLNKYELHLELHFSTLESVALRLQVRQSPVSRSRFLYLAASLHLSLVLLSLIIENMQI